MRFSSSLLSLFTATLCSSAYALTYPLTQSEVIGEVITFPAKYEDTFAAYARDYDIGADSLERANPGVDVWIPGTGTEITIPSAFVLPTDVRNGIVINLPELRLYYYDTDAKQIHTYPIGIGRDGWATPLTRTSVTEKTENPTWVVPASILAEHEAMGKPIAPTIAPGPDNPLGEHRLRLALPGYLIHGTNAPIGVGRRVTHGCIRLFPNDIEALFNMVNVGTPVVVVNEPIKLGWRDNDLYLEVHPLLAEHPMTDDQRKIQLVSIMETVLNERQANVDWSLVHTVMAEQNGIAQVVGKGI